MSTAPEKDCKKQDVRLPIVYAFFIRKTRGCTLGKFAAYALLKKKTPFAAAILKFSATLFKYVVLVRN